MSSHRYHVRAAYGWDRLVRLDSQRLPDVAHANVLELGRPMHMSPNRLPRQVDIFRLLKCRDAKVQTVAAEEM